MLFEEIKVHPLDQHGNVRISGKLKEAIVITWGQDHLALDPRNAPKVRRFLCLDRHGTYVGTFSSLAGAFRIGWGRTQDDAVVMAAEAMKVVVES